MAVFKRRRALTVRRASFMKLTTTNTSENSTSSDAATGEVSKRTRRNVWRAKIVVHPDSPDVLRLATSPRQLTDFHSKGFKEINYKRIARELHALRKRLDLNNEEFCTLLLQRGLETSPYTLKEMEQGRAPKEVTVFWIKQLASALGVAVRVLVLPRQRVGRSVEEEDVYQLRSGSHVYRVKARSSNGQRYVGYCIAKTEEAAVTMFLSRLETDYNAPGLLVEHVRRYATKDRCFTVIKAGSPAKAVPDENPTY